METDPVTSSDKVRHNVRDPVTMVTAYREGRQVTKRKYFVIKPMLRSYASMIVLFFCRNNFIDVYRHMFIVALDFMLRRSME
jgi:hypothetical protein